MSLGKSKFLLLTIFLFTCFLSAGSEEKIISAPLINLEKLKPSFEETDENINDIKNYNLIQNKKKIQTNNNKSAEFIGLDKITAKTSNLTINIGETKKFGPLEIKVLKCGKVNSLNKDLDDNVAYVQVKDTSKIDNEKVFIFNGWTFSSDPSIAPFDHAIYNIQLIDCNKV